MNPSQGLPSSLKDIKVSRYRASPDSDTGGPVDCPTMGELKENILKLRGEREREREREREISAY